MSDEAEYFTIGQLARRAGVLARTIRFWSDSGGVQPARRTAGGYRLYDPESAARLDLVRSLRELGLGLGVIRDVLDRTVTVAQVAELHIAVLDAEIRTLRLRRAVLRTGHQPRRHHEGDAADAQAFPAVRPGAAAAHR